MSWISDSAEIQKLIIGRKLRLLAYKTMGELVDCEHPRRGNRDILLPGFPVTASDRFLVGLMPYKGPFCGLEDGRVRQGNGLPAIRMVICLVVQ